MAVNITHPSQNSSQFFCLESRCESVLIVEDSEENSKTTA